MDFFRNLTLGYKNRRKFVKFIEGGYTRGGFNKFYDKIHETITLEEIDTLAYCIGEELHFLFNEPLFRSKRMTEFFEDLAIWEENGWFVE